jgi:hypothetical protein
MPRRNAARAAMRLSIREAKKNFFRVDTAGRICTDIATRVNRQFGAYTRLAAQHSMKRGRRATSTSQLTPLQLAQYNAARRRWHRGGERWREPLLPRQPSEPGSPPHYNPANPFLRKFLFFSQATEGGVPLVVIGPTRLEGGSGNSGEVPRLHEYGGVGVASGAGGVVSARFPARPYMQPAFEKALAQVPRFTLRAAREIRSGTR